VVDCANGATYHIAPKVLAELGARVTAIGVEPNGLNINEGCGSTHPEHLQQTVLAEQADVGLALDGDGDRLIMVDSRGEIVDGDQLLYIIASTRQAAGRLDGGVVGTVMSNLGLEHALQRQQIPFVRTPVGDRYVMERLQRENWQLGGESSGHLLCLDRTTTGDGIVSALQVLAAMVQSGRDLRELCAGMEKYPQTLLNVQFAERRPVLDDPGLRAAVEAAEQRLADRGRVLLRASGTEPLIRVMVEGQDADLVADLAEQLAGAVRSALSG
jgi:phosphoglucosamine mutase